MRGPGQNVRDCLKKSRESALQAVEIYNKPATPFRTGGFVVLMVIAWQSLFHGVFFQRRVQPYYRKKNSKRFVRIDGDHAWWELSECLQQYFGDDNGPIRKNLEFFAKLRNKIEHRTMPDLDPMIFGECQALLLNFDDMLMKEFGEKARLSESLYLPLQFTRARAQIPRGKGAAGWSDVSTFVQAYRSTLGADVQGSNAYSWQVFLLPRIGSSRSPDIAIEWITYDPDKPEEMEQYEKVAALIKSKHVPVYNLDLYKPNQVSKLVATATGRKFTPYHHTAAWKHFKVRPEKAAADPKACAPEFCVYDTVHNDYLYTKKWVDKLSAELGDEAAYNLVMGKA